VSDVTPKNAGVDRGLVAIVNGVERMVIVRFNAFGFAVKPIRLKAVTGVGSTIRMVGIDAEFLLM